MTVPGPSVAAVATLPKRLNAIRHVPLKEYRKKHRYPWIVAYSGGKDSTLLLQLVWEVVAGLPAEAQRRRLLVVGNDTLSRVPLDYPTPSRITEGDRLSCGEGGASDRHGNHRTLHRLNVLGQRHWSRVHFSNAKFSLVH